MLRSLQDTITHAVRCTATLGLVFLLASCSREGSGNTSTTASLDSAERSAGAPSQPARLALVIGNDSYRYVAPLSNARNDAKLFASTLKDAGFDVIGGVRTDLDRHAMWAALDELKRRIAKGDDVIFYYAGHGVQIGSDAVLLPVDIDADSGDQVVRDGLNLVGIQDELAKARFALLVIDACRNNPFPPKSGSRGIGDSRGIIPIEPAEGNAILLAASRGQTALDSVPGVTTHNGLFTYRLVQAIREPGVDILSALRQVRDQIEDAAKRANHEQRPALVEEMRGTFVLFPKPGATATPQATQATVRIGIAANVVASVNSTNLSRALFEFYVKGATGKPAGELLPEQQASALESLVRAEVAAQEAQKEGLDKTGETKDRMDAARQNILERLNKEHKPSADEVDWALELGRLSVFQQALATHYLADRHPTEAELKAEYDLQVAKMPGIEYHARHILVSDEATAQKVINRLEHGEKFDALAKKLSMDASKANGGDLGWFTSDRMVKPFADAVIALRPGAYTHQPIQTQYGWHVVQLLETRPFTPPPIDRVKDRLRQVVENKKFQSYLDGLMNLASIQRNL